MVQLLIHFIFFKVILVWGKEIFRKKIFFSKKSQQGGIILQSRQIAPWNPFRFIPHISRSLRVSFSDSPPLYQSFYFSLLISFFIDLCIQLSPSFSLCFSINFYLLRVREREKSTKADRRREEECQGWGKTGEIHMETEKKRKQEKLRGKTLAETY